MLGSPGSFWTFPSPLRFPELRPRVDVAEGLASHVDIVPTVLAYLGIDEMPPSVQGRSLVPSLYRGDPSGEEVLVEELGPSISRRAQPQRLTGPKARSRAQPQAGFEDWNSGVSQRLAV